MTTFQRTDYPKEWLQVSDDMNLAQFMLDAEHPLKKSTFSMIQSETGRRISIDEMRSRTDALAAALKSTYGIGKDSVVMISGPNTVDYPIAIWAIHKLGGVVTLSNPLYTMDEVAHQVKLTKATLFICYSAVLEKISPVIAKTGIQKDRALSLDKPVKGYPNLEDLISKAEHKKNPVKHVPGGERVAMLALSSGTTGAPKAVKLSHKGIVSNILQIAAHYVLSGIYGFEADDVLLQSLPFFHVAGLYSALHLCLYLGMHVVIAEHFDFAKSVADIPKYKITTLGTVPPQAIGLARVPGASKFTTLKKLMVGAAPVSANLHHLLEKSLPGCHIWQLYGLTEVSCTLAMATDKTPPGSTGQLLPGFVAKVVKTDGSLGKAGERGELYVKTPSAALGYLDNPEATKETFDGEWVRTGDEVEITEANEIFIMDRVKDFLKVRGFQVAPAELEGCLLGHPDVLDSGVIGIPHDYSGQVPIAFVVLKDTATERIKAGETSESDIRASILQYVSEKLAPYKKLHGVTFVPAIPKTASGKILRRVLRDTWESSNKAKL